MAAHSHSARPFEVFCTHITPHEKPLVGGTNDQQQNIFHIFLDSEQRFGNMGVQVLAVYGSNPWKLLYEFDSLK